METWFYKIYQWGQKNRILFFSGILAFVLLMSYGAFQIKFEEDITRLLPKSEQFETTSKLLDQLQFKDKITVIIEKDAHGDTDDMVDLARTFINQLETQKDYVKAIKGTVEDESIQNTIRFVYEHLPLFLEEQDYEVLAQKIHTDSVASTVDSNYRSLLAPTALVTKGFIQKDPFGIGPIALKKLQQLNLSDDFHVVDGFLFEKKEDKLFLFIDPVYSGSETQHNATFVENLKHIKNDLNEVYQGRVNLDYFGASFVAVANATQIKSDIQKTVAISISVLMLLLIAFYKRVSIPFLLLLPTAMSALMALFLLHFIKDALSAISLSIGAVLIGITIDYALHILTHYKQSGAIKTLYQDLSKPIMLSAATTAIAFLCLVFVHSEALRDLGIFASITVLGSGFISLIVIPQLYTPKNEKEAKKTTNSFLNRLAYFPFDKNKWLLGLCLGILAISTYTFNKVGFNNDLATLNYFPEELKQAEQKLENTLNGDSKTLYMSVFGDDLEEVLQQNEALSKRLKQAVSEHHITSYSSLGDLIVSQTEQQERITRWNHFWDQKNREGLQTAFEMHGTALGFKPDAYQAFFEQMNQTFEPIGIEQFYELNPQIMEEFYSEKDGHYVMSSLVQLPEEQRLAFLEDYPTTTHFMVIDRKQMNEAFLGTIVQDFNSLVNYSILAVFLVLWSSFRRLELALVCLVPIVITGFITAGLMGLFQIEFTIFSTIVCTLIFGQGVDFSIFMTKALQKEYTTGQNEMPIYRASILLAVLTTLLAVGTLIFAKHPALQSIASVSLIGMTVAVLISFVVYPYLFRICFTNRQARGQSPVTFIVLLQSLVGFIYFGLFGPLYSVIMRLIMLVMPWSKKRKLLFFSRGMQGYMRSVLNLNPLVKKQVRNPYGEDFKKPAILIANHTSFLDSLVMGTVYRRVVFLVNDWVYKSPVFGRAIQMAGFYPVSDGVENSIEHLRERVKMGFSLMIFPEGTRSRTNDVQRFHKGAFYLAEQLQLDIIPVFIHGNSEIIPKGDYITYGGHIIATIGQRIAYEDQAFGTTYTERTKAISKSFKKDFAILRTELEGPNYFKEKMYLAYLYKDGTIQQEVKKEFKTYKQHYHNLNQHLTDKERIVHISEDYGQWNFLLSMQQSKRNIKSWIRDEYRNSVAQNIYISSIRNITYTSDIWNEQKATLVVSTTIADLAPEQLVSFEKIIVMKKEGIELPALGDRDVYFENDYLIIWKKV